MFFFSLGFHWERKREREGGGGENIAGKNISITILVRHSSKVFFLLQIRFIYSPWLKLFRLVLRRLLLGRKQLAPYIIWPSSVDIHYEWNKSGRKVRSNIHINCWMLPWGFVSSRIIMELLLETIATREEWKAIPFAVVSSKITVNARH